MDWALRQASKEVNEGRERKTKLFPVSEWSNSVRYNPIEFNRGINFGRGIYTARRNRAIAAIEDLRPEFEKLQRQLIDLHTAVYYADEALDEINKIVESEAVKQEKVAVKKAESADEKIKRLQAEIAKLEALKASLVA
jgi:hypothetical protein